MNKQPTNLAKDSGFSEESLDIKVNQTDPARDNSQVKVAGDGKSETGIESQQTQDQKRDGLINDQKEASASGSSDPAKPSDPKSSSNDQEAD